MQHTAYFPRGYRRCVKTRVCPAGEGILTAMESGNRRGVIVMSAVVLLLIGFGIFWYSMSAFEGGADQDAAVAQEPLPAPSAEVKEALYKNLETSGGSDASGAQSPSSDERAQLLEQTQATQTTNTETAAPSQSDRQKLLESLGQ